MQTTCTSEGCTVFKPTVSGQRDVPYQHLFGQGVKMAGWFIQFVKGSHPSLAQMKQNHNSISLHVFCLFIKWLLLNKEPEKHNNKKMSIKYSPRGCHFGDSYSFMIEIQARKPAGMHSGCYQISSSSPPSHHHTLVRNGKEQTWMLLAALLWAILALNQGWGNGEYYLTLWRHWLYVCGTNASNIQIEKEAIS